MKCVQYVAVILVYKNVADLNDCLQSIKKTIPDCQCIVVNAFYDKSSKDAVREIAMQHKCDFLNIENKGYSYGNNAGISYAEGNYTYKHLIISNPDVVVQSFNLSNILGADIIAPNIKTLSGKRQNPMLLCKNSIGDKMIFYGFKHKRRIPLFLAIGINKLIRTIGVGWNACLRRHTYAVYQAHGSFVIICRDAVQKLFPIYDEHMFLFAEENVLSFKASTNNLKTVYTSEISILHKEDGSMKLSDIKVDDELAKSNLYYFENYEFVKDN